MIRYVEPTEQLVVKIFARNLICSMAFYRQLGFELLAHRGSFVELAWEGHRLFLDERRDVPAAAELPQANIRIMIPDVDAYWESIRTLPLRSSCRSCSRPSPASRRWLKKASGRQKINQWTHWLTVPTGMLQAYGTRNLINFNTGGGAPIIKNFGFDQDPFGTLAIVISMTAGTRVLVWMGELITQYGIGQGLSMIISGASSLACRPNFYRASRPAWSSWRCWSSALWRWSAS